MRSTIGPVLIAAIHILVPAPVLGQEATEVRVVPSIGVGPQVGDQNLLFGSLHALIEAEIEWDGIVATGYFEPFSPISAGCTDDCTPPTQLGISGSVRGGSFMYGAGFSLGLGTWPNVLIGRLAAEPGPFRIQFRPELMLDNDFIVLVPILLGLRIPW